MIAAQQPSAETSLLSQSLRVGLSSQEDSGLDLTSTKHNIGKFYFPYGRPKITHSSDSSAQSLTSDPESETFENTLKALFGVSDTNPEGCGLTESEFVPVTLACGVSRYINAALHKRSSENADTVTYSQFKR
eukprot:jgi/Hompol1/5377/HPOL_001958-RA